MKTVFFSEALTGLNALMNDVCNEHAPTVIARDNGEAVVILSLSDFNSMEETMYLLGSSKNARRLTDSISQLQAGKVKSRELIHRDEKETLKQENR